MSTDVARKAQVAVPAADPLTIKEIVALLIKHYGFHEGQFDLLSEYQFGLGAFGPSPESITPGVMVGLTKLGLIRAPNPGPLTVDAAEVNPEPPRRVARARKVAKANDA